MRRIPDSLKNIPICAQFLFPGQDGLLVLAGCNMTASHRIGTREIARWDAAGGTPVAAKTLDGISLLVWIAVVVCGRWIGFTLH